jgi:glycosyltransferase involved in cell wall biosynthesis/serine acetyltransferase
MFDNIKADFRRLSPRGEFRSRTLVAGVLSQGFQAILTYRCFNWFHRHGIPTQPLRFFCERFIEISTGISIPASCHIGRGFRIHHFGGIILHPTTRIGVNCTLYQGVTIGDRGDSGGAAEIGNNVVIGAGAKILGEISIGDNCLVGANAVVTQNVPAGHIATASPCRIREWDPGEQSSEGPGETQSLIPRVMDLRGTYKGGGGPDKTVLNSAAQHDANRVYVLVTYLRQPDDKEFQIPLMAAKRGIHYTDLMDGRMLDLECTLGLRRLIRRHRLQVIHTHDDKTLFYGWLLKWFIPGVRLLHTCHSHAEYERKDFPTLKDWWKFSIRKRLVLLLMKRHHRPILTVSDNTRQRLIRGGVDPRGIKVLPNGIDTAIWNRRSASPVLRQELGLPPGGILVGTVARITYDKDLPTFYKVVERVTQRFPSVRFVIVGDGYGNELAEARAEVERMGLGNRIHLTGHRSDLKNVYCSLDLFLMTSRTEGMPNTVLEAMALELPVVSTNIGGVPELVIDGETGFLCPPGDAAALAEAVCRLLSDDELRRKFAQVARQRVEERFEFLTRVRTMEEIYAWFAGTTTRPPAVLAEII